MIEDTIKECVERIASSGSARMQKYILLADSEQLDYFAQHQDVAGRAVKPVNGNDAIRQFFFPEGRMMQPRKTDRFLYVVNSEDAADTPELMSGMMAWARRQRFSDSVVLLRNDHYNQGTCTYRENMRPQELDLTQQISPITRHELFQD